MDDLALAQHITAERRAWELVTALQAAVCGEAHWRRDAQRLLLAISAADYPKPEEKPLHAEATAARGDGEAA